MTSPDDPGKRARHLHQVAADMDPSTVSVRSVHDAFTRKLTDLNRRQLLAGGTSDVQLQDPRDILRHLLALVAGVHSTGLVPPMDLVDAIGAQATALAMSVARVEDLRIDLGDDAA
jgi:hypothetical protein